MSAREMTLTVNDFMTLLNTAERDQINGWCVEAIGHAWNEVFEIRLSEGWCEFDHYLRRARDLIHVLYWGDCDHTYGASRVWMRRRVRCPLPPVWPLGRVS